jgi:DNA-binding LytR/AlgR family response regulator
MLNEWLNIAICEDLTEDGILLVKRIKECSAAVKTDVFESGEIFLQNYQKGMYHLIFLDIYMNGISGIDVAANLREQGDDVPIAFITISRDHALEANRYRSIHYIEKPVTADAVAHTLNIAGAIRERNSKEVLAVTDSKRKIIEIPYDNICYIEVKNHRCTIYLTENRMIEPRTATTLSKLEIMLPKSRFFRCHQSFIINIDHVREIDNKLKAFIMNNGGIAYIRRGHLKKYEEIYKLWIIEKTRRF